MRILGRVFLLLLLLVAVWGYFFLEAAGVFMDIPPRPLPGCRPITGVVGVEDLAIDGTSGFAYLSGYDRRVAMSGLPARGAIWVLDTHSVGAPVDATVASLPEGFQPHGIGLYKAPDGGRTLFAINHAGGRHAIEIFDVHGPQLVHRQTVTGDALLSPNDVVGVGPNAFYVTNDHGSAPGWMRNVEDFGRLKLSNVQYFDGRVFRTAIEGLGGANGINVSADGRSLYVSAALERTMHVYDRDIASGTLVRRASVSVPGFADNIDVDASGDLLLAVHSKILDFLAHVRDPAKLSPSHVLWLKADGHGSFVPQTLYYNTGEEISGVSVAASDGARLLIGPIFESKVLSCQWPDHAMPVQPGAVQQQ